jgi:hypothetical protein
MHPLVNPRRQRLVAAANFLNGEVVGKAYYLFTHGKFYEYYQKSTPIPSDYVFSLVTGGNAFAIDASTGIITISNIANFTATTIITVRCTFRGIYHEDQEIAIDRVPVDRAVYIDYTFEGTSTGTREAPYIRARNYPIETRYGKTFFYKSGTQTLDEYLTITNSIDDDWTQFGRWGTGNKPEINLSTNLESSRFMNFGSSSDPSQAGYKIRVCELKFTHDCSTNIYPFRVGGQGQFFELYNLDFTGTTQRQGFIWCPGDSTTVTSEISKTRIFSNLTFADFREQIVSDVPDGCRCVKFERGGNIAENLQAISTFTGLNSAPISAVDQPFTEISWAYMDTTTANNSRGPNIRVSHQNYRNCYVKGPDVGLAIANNNQNGFQVNWPVDGTSSFEYCIAEGSATAGVTFFNAENTDVAAPATAVRVHGIVTINCANGAHFNNGVRNVTISSSILCGNTTNGVWHSQGSGCRVLNSVVLKNGSSDVNVSNGSLRMDNTVRGTESGTLTGETNSTNILGFIDYENNDFRLATGSALIGAGTFFAAETDAIDVAFNNPPSIGAFEFFSPQQSFAFALSVNSLLTSLSSQKCFAQVKLT